MACSYLLTLSDAPKPANSHTAREHAKQRAEEIMDIMPPDIDATSNAEARADAASQVSDDPIKHGISSPEPHGVRSTAQSTAEITDEPQQAKPDMLQHVLDLHTAGRMKRPSTPSDKKVKAGVSIPSQRRWLYYWSLLIARQGPQGFWSMDSAERAPAPKVRLTHIKIKMKELTGFRANLWKAANAFIDKTGKGKAHDATKGAGHVWASLARYDDKLVDTLERWERLTRSEDGNMGKRKEGSEHQDEGDLSQLFADAKWDKAKMVRPFARLGTVGNDAVCREGSDQVKFSPIYVFDYH